MSGSRRGTNNFFTVHKSAIVTVGTEIDLGPVDVGRPHCFAGVQFFADAGGAIPAISTSGTVELQIQTFNNAPWFESPPENIIDAFNPTTISWSANTIRVKATPDSINVATHYRLVVTCNEA